MAERRMFAKTIVLSDAFLDMPLSTRCLYFTLGMLADDDGFVNSPKGIMRQVGASIDDLNLLAAKKFILDFESGVIVIKHWRLHNYIQKDRYKSTKYLDEKECLTVDERGVYTKCIQSVSKMDTQDRLELELELREDNNNISPSATPKAKATKHKYGEYKNVLLTDEEYEKLRERFPDYEQKIETLSEGLALKGYKYKSHYLAILKWARNDEGKAKTQAQAKSSNMFFDMLGEDD